MIVYLSVRQILGVHEEQLQLYGGASGVRDRGLLESALARPAMTFAGEDLYPDVAAKAAALTHSLALNHPFVDGNKRVAAHAAVLFANTNGYALLASPRELVDTTLTVAEGKIEAEALAIWFRQRLKAIER